MKFIPTCVLTIFLCFLAGPLQADPLQTGEVVSVEEVDSSTAIEKAEAWVLDFIVRTAPPGRKIWYPDGQETEEEAMVRYKDIARDVVRVAFDPDTQPIFKSKTSGRSRTAMVWLGIMLQESGFMMHVDKNLGEKARGDNGRSWCMMQVKIGKGRTIPWNWKHNRIVHWGDPEEEIFEGYTGIELIEDRKKCISEGHKLIRASFKTCEALPLRERLTGYAVGKCVAKPGDAKDEEYVSVGKAKSRARMDTAINYFQRTATSRGFEDQDVVAEFQAMQDGMGPLKIARHP